MSMSNKGGIFTSVQKKREKRSNFNLSHDVKLSLDMGEVVPIYVQECVPGDSIRISSSSMLRMAPLVSPVMHKIDVYKEFFFVPNRILWPNWETFITGSRNGKQLSAEEMPAFPVVYPYGESMEKGVGTLSDYLGLPQPEDFSEDMNPLLPVSALPFAAYQRIWDEYYRDENLIESMYDSVEDQFENYNMLPDGAQPPEIMQQLGSIRPRAWEHDYFTSALPWAQKGEAVEIPIDLSSIALEFDNLGGNTKAVVTTGEAVDGDAGNHPHMTSQWGTDRANLYLPTASFPSGQTVNIDNTANLNISADGGAGVSINDLRAAIKLQEWLETNARGGSRYFESIYAHFGVKSPDSRLQRPEFIGSSRNNMIISEVLQTSSPQNLDDTPQGNMSGHGSSVGTSKNFRYYCQEHGYIIGVMSVMPKTAYQQGIPKHWNKYSDRLQYYFPEFAHLGEQEIEMRELYATGTVAELEETFGYIPRYSEYKFINSRVCGDFRDTLKFWHMGRIFDDKPDLNDSFVSSNPTKRIFAVQDLPQDGDTPAGSIRDYHSIYAHVYHDVKASRLMPKYGTPTL